MCRDSATEYVRFISNFSSIQNMTIQDKDADEIRIVKTIGDANKSKPGLDPVLTHESTWMLI